MILTKEQADKVYDVLVDWGGAVESERFDFIYRLTTEEVREWRFRGHFGFGGKFRNTSGRWYVDFYQENETPERLKLAEQINQKLGELRDQFVVD